KQQRKNEPVDRPAEKGDLVVLDFVGSVDGKEFPGGSAKGHKLELGSGSFIPGFEDQLIGAKAGEHRAVAVTFPADYGAGDLAGKEASFAVDVKEVRAILPQPIDESLAEAVGMENLQALRDTVRAQIERDYGGIARQRLKRQLLDRLAERHHFPVPQGMVDIEFDVIWKQFEAERERAKKSGAAEAEEGKSDDEIKAEYRDIAVRRVRLGLLLSEVGRSNNISVTQEEINRALSEEVRRFPGHEREVIEYYRNQQGALDNLRAPIFEDKVIDYILEMAKVSDRTVPIAELIKAAEAEDE
ncbi:MAG TPA: trigger factor, partial [Micropepsaceae bacterium]|nr:trigger factor [Micropepsaceae bacterium]